MARIRSVKPEYFESEDMAKVSLTAMLTFIGLSGQADDHGRFTANSKILYGKIWVLRDDTSPAQTEEDLDQLEAVGVICRYTGCDGRRYVHQPNWFKDQRIDKPSVSRLPACPHHAAERCGVCKGPCVNRGTQAPEPSSVQQHAPEPVHPMAADAVCPAAEEAALLRRDLAGEGDAVPAAISAKLQAEVSLGEDSAKAPGVFVEPSTPGSRILDPGSTTPSGRTAPDASVSTPQLIAEYAARFPKDRQPPGDVRGHLGRIVKKLLAEGIDARYIRAALGDFAEAPGHPSRLPSLVNEAMNPGTRRALRAWAPSTGHRAWTNPDDVAAAYGGAL
ncbi:hypothetical protein ABH940_005443 [Streptacidiphilus sp. BW17]|uniref:hypothetical protein n=1 Tax=Streptacidiphilus sp. BW17 TaxID=3156274 RepID=UPI003514BE0A